MASCVSRLRRRHRSLTTLDTTFRIPEHTEMMMDCAGTTDHMHQLPCFAATKFLTLETMGLALIQEYTCITRGNSVAAVSDRFSHEDHERIVLLAVSSLDAFQRHELF